MATVIRKDTLQPWRGERVGTNNLAPVNATDLFSDAELAAVGLARAIPAVVPAGKVATAMAYALDAGGNVIEAPTLADAPTQAQLDAAADAANIDGVISNPRMGKVIFALVNAIRALQGKQAITPAQLRDWVATL